MQKIKEYTGTGNWKSNNSYLISVLEAVLRCYLKFSYGVGFQQPEDLSICLDHIAESTPLTILWIESKTDSYIILVIRSPIRRHWQRVPRQVPGAKNYLIPTLHL